MQETSKNGAHKLTVERVKVIQQLFQFEDIKDSDIAGVFGVSRESINHIRHGIRWADVTGIQPKTGNNFRQYTIKEDTIKQQMKDALINHISNFR
jgi:hypothetical protein